MAHLMRVTLSDVARAAGLSIGGTSYALRGHPSIPPRTVQRVQRLAAELGYTPDLRISSLMATIRRRQPLPGRETLALVWIDTPRATEGLPVHLQHYIRVTGEAARRRALQLGCGLEEFWLGDGEMKPARLSQILGARGIAGAVFSPAASERPIEITLDWHALATAIIGNTDCTPVLHRAAHYHYRSVWRTLERLQAEGIRRPAAILSPTVQERIHRTQLAAFLANHPDSRAAPNLVRYCVPGRLATVPPWPRRLAPDALILGWQIDRATAAALRRLVPSARRLVTLEWHPHGALPGMDPGNEDIAANAIDLVVAQLHRNEFGLPVHPTTVLLDGSWRETESDLGATG
jgi:LacI family transcriptional regulator